MLKNSHNETYFKNAFSILLLMWLSLFPISPVSADTTLGDTEIYGANVSSIHANVLIIMDNSGSMNETVPSAVGYDGATTYAVQNVCGSGGNTACNASNVYRWRNSTWQYYTTLSAVQSNCTSAYNTFSSQGTYTGRLRTSGSCSLTRATFAAGNYVNFIFGQSGGIELETPKIDIVKRAITDLLSSSAEGVDYGLQIFNTTEGGFLLPYGGTSGITDMDADADNDGTTNREELITAVNNVDAETWTPLAENLFEAGRYFSGDQTAFNGSFTYTSPIQYSCQKNYIIFLTDGMSTQDLNSVLTTICNSGDCDGDNAEPGSYPSSGSDYLDDVAKYLYDTDLRGNLDGVQNVTTYTIGFGLSEMEGTTEEAIDLLQRAASHGHGSYYSAYNTEGLTQAFTEIIGTIVQDNTSFVAPVIPLNPENRTFSGDDLYLGFFKPGPTAFWSGNIKKYNLDVNEGTVKDKFGVVAIDSSGDFLSTSTSYWSTEADGGRIDAGGVGEVLLNRSTARNLYTYLGTSDDLTDSANAFTTSNTALTYTALNAADDTAKNEVINSVHGFDVTGADPSLKRDWILGDVLHSRPLVLHYSASRTVIFVGGNDGVLHAFENSDGSELWGFIPPDLLHYLSDVTSGSTHPYFVDGSPKSYIKDYNGNGVLDPTEGDQVILIFGERRGGRAIQSSSCGDGIPVHRGSYYALDVTDPESPTLLWRIGPPLTDLDADSDVDVSSETFLCEMGETWSDPVIARVKIAGVDRYLFFVGGGYDETTQDLVPPSTDSKGRALFAFDVFTGQKVWEYSKTTSVDNDSGGAHDNMTYAIPSQVTLVDSDGNRYIDRVYVGDLGGQLWRFDVANNDTSNWTGRILFKSNPGADDSTGRKIFYPPDYVQEIGYDVLFFGTGDREHARNTTAAVDRLYAVKDDNSVSVALTESDLKDVTTDLLQSLTVTAAQQAEVLADLASMDGWFIKLDQNEGEKVVSPTAVFAKVAYYTTYAPDPGESSDPCQVNRGTARAYALNYLTGEAVFNYDSANDADYEDVTNLRSKGGDGEVLERGDRFQEIGSGLPSGVVIIINETGEMGLIGVGGGLNIPQIKSGQTAIRIYWRTR